MITFYLKMKRDKLIWRLNKDHLYNKRSIQLTLPMHFSQFDFLVVEWIYFRAHIVIDYVILKENEFSKRG